MTVRARTVFRCTECGTEHPKWGGRCDACGEWNTLVEEVVRTTSRAVSAAARRAPPPGVPATPARVGAVQLPRTPRSTTGLRELDIVLGGGVVPGSVVLVGGEPGIGKSTLLLQVAASVVAAGGRALYVSAEESAPQIRLRAERLGASALDVEMLAETSLESIIASATAHAPSLLVVDSIQTIFSEELDGAPGNVGQVRECAGRLMRFAKESGSAVFIVGHVTKGGGVAGPKTLEHIVDTVLYFEGDGSLDFRVLRATKNRFGSVDEIGVFQMTGGGLVAVENPSALFMGAPHDPASGSAVTALIEGTRPVLVEIQALVTRAGYGTPQRVTSGVDARRLALLLAVLEKRAGLPYSQLDVFVNVAGGLRLSEPVGDLAVACALASSLRDVALPPGAVFLGELGLAGEIRGVSQLERRLAEAAQLGMSVAHIGGRATPARSPSGIEVVPSPDLRALFGRLFA
ncbi:MAG TPA: DNA repair protein RadA [Gemmatimonadaceae bacterium]|nr:DNA repair protein RadA [Gemmatimonadaceae bacterium]